MIGHEYIRVLQQPTTRRVFPPYNAGPRRIRFIRLLFNAIGCMREIFVRRA